MIQRLRFKLIALAVLFQLILLIVIVLLGNYASYLKLVDNADTVIDELWKEPWADYDPTPSEAPAPSQEPEPPGSSEEAPAAKETDAAESAAPEAPQEAPEPPQTAEEELQPGGPPASLPGKGKHGAGEREAWRYMQQYAAAMQDWTEEDFAAWQDWWNDANQAGPHEDILPPVSEKPSEEPQPTDSPSETPVSPTPAPQEAPQEERRPSEVPFESRYFIVTESVDGELLSINMEHIISVSPVEALAMVQEVKHSGENRGFQGDLRYGRKRDGQTVSYLFLDCRRDLETFKNSFLSHILISLLGLLLVFALMVIFSHRMVKPVAESYEKQKQFVSAAGHELRTPLTIINADAELLGMEIGDNEWLQDIVVQSGRMSELTNSLLTLSRMDEGREVMQMIEFPVSDIVEETVGSFEALAQSQGKTISAKITPMLSMVGAEKSIRQLTSILMDNAVKYSLGTINVSLEQRDDNILLSVENSAQPVSPEQLSQFFDRFYRTEQSRNSETGGYGLGLSIAKSIADAHKG